MNKIISILIAGIFFCTAVLAQEKKYVFMDSSLLEPPDETILSDSVIEAAPVEDAGQQTTGEKAVEIDTTLYYTSLGISKDSVDAWKSNRSFAYVKYLDSLLKVEQDRNKKQEASITQSASDNSWLDRFISSKGLQVFLWVLAGAFILFILYNLFLADGVFRKTSRTSAKTEPDVTEEIIDHESDFDTLIQKAIQSGNFRLGVRYHYLKTLHLLAGKNQIQLAADKTNYQYVRELSDKNYQNDFAGLTLHYEYVWYGEFAINELVYIKLKESFVSFNNKF